MGLDSVELILAIEEGFGIEIPNAGAARIRTVRDMRDLVVGELRRLGREADPDAVYGRLHQVIVEQIAVEPSAVVLDAEFVRDLRIQ